MPAKNQLGTLLLERGLINQEQLDAALEEQRQSRKSLGRVLIDEGTVSESDLVATLAARIGLDFVDLLDYAIDPSAVGLISDSLARRLHPQNSPRRAQLSVIRMRGDDQDLEHVFSPVAEFAKNSGVSRS